MRFRDREDAGQRLAEALARYRGRDDVVVLGIPRGGVLVAAPVAGALGSPLDVVLVRKLRHPMNPEYAIGAVDEDGGVALGELRGVPDDYLRRETEDQREEIRRRRDGYSRGMPEADLRDKLVLVVDDGVATGLTAMQAVRFARNRGAWRVVLAAPVMSPQAERTLSREADEVVTLETPAGFMAVGQFYADFPQTTDEEVVAVLHAHQVPAGWAPSEG